MPVVFRDKSVMDSLTPRISNDSYLTPYELAFETVGWLSRNVTLPNTPAIYALDPGAGNGVWGRALMENSESLSKLVITGIEIRKKKNPGNYDYWYPRQDFLTWKPTAYTHDLVIGNPPFLKAEAFIRKSFEFLSFNGVICFLLPTDFTHTKGRSNGLFNEHPPRHIVSLAERPQFTGPNGKSLGKANTNNYVLGIWVNDSLSHTMWHSWSWK